VHVYLGGATVSAADWNGTTAPRRIELVGPEANEQFAGYYGLAVAFAGDVDGDGYGDLLAGASLCAGGNGAGYLYLGGAAPAASDWNGATAPRRIDLVGPTANEQLGYMVAPAGDVDGDGFFDFVVSSPYDGAHLYLGGPSPSGAEWNGASAPRRIDLTSPDAAGSYFGHALAAAGDLDGDGWADFAVGGLGSSALPYVGIVHLYFGEAMPLATDWNGGAPPKRTDLHNPDSTTVYFGYALQ
jgi:hypothetical protein